MGAFISALDIVVVATALPMAMPVLAPGKERTV